LAVSDDGIDWVLINASPDILAQIRAFPPLQPARQIRDTGIAAVLVTDAQIDHVTGLLMLRERREPLPLYATEPVWGDLSTGFPVASLLSHYCGVAHQPIGLDGEPFTIAPLASVRFTAIPLGSKAPPYSPHRHAPVLGDNIGLLIEDTFSKQRVFYAPGLGEIDDAVLAAMRGAHLLLVDGTVWHDDEMIRLGLTKKTGADMGHLALFGPGGMIEVLDGLPPSLPDGPVRKVLVHINNTNPILREDAPERAELARHGIEIGHDGMQFDL
jgi:pyrroloquinoline quinone biosynthesis protein B